MSKTEVRKIVNKYIKKLKAEKYPFSDVYLFGSYANGKTHKWSDIDIAVISKNRKNKKKLWKIAIYIDPRIEPHALSSSDFKKDWIPLVYEIKKHGIKISK